jgi:hypothetical protein
MNLDFDVYDVVGGGPFTQIVYPADFDCEEQDERPEIEGDPHFDDREKWEQQRPIRRRSSSK